MNKKAQYFNIALVLLTLVVLITALVLFAKKTEITNKMGEQQMNLIKRYIDGEKLLLYIDLVAEEAAYKTIYDLGQNGGFESASKCGTYNGFQLWNNLTTDCYPNFNKEFLSLYSKNIDLFFSKYQEIGIPQNNYHILIEEDEVKGIAKSNIDFWEIDTPYSYEGTGQFAWPINPQYKTITSCYGERVCEECREKFHKAIDIGAPKGTEVLAADEGVVTFVGGGFNMVRINHGNGYKTEYLHNSKILVKVGENVKKGQKIAEVGGYGPKGPNEYIPHLHFNLYKNGIRIDPLTQYNITELNLKFSRNSNCVYYIERNNYPYADIIRGNTVG